MPTTLTPKETDKLFRVPTNGRFRLKDHDTGWAGGDYFQDLSKDELKERAQSYLTENLNELEAAQQLLWATDCHSVLVVLQAMDAAGKDGTIKHVMSGVNPQGCQVFSFKKPSAEDLDHNFLWRYSKCLPERGRIGIFNRSYYEDVLVVKVHPELIGREIPRKKGKLGKKFWEQRYEDINAFERHLVRNGTVILKFFLNVSKDEQKKRFLDRLDTPSKNWKFALGDVRERGLWREYMEAYEDMIRHTATPEAPWFVVPADHKWFARLVVSAAIVDAMKKLDLRFPTVDRAQKKTLKAAEAALRRKGA